MKVETGGMDESENMVEQNPDFFRHMLDTDYPELPPKLEEEFKNVLQEIINMQHLTYNSERERDAVCRRVGYWETIWNKVMFINGGGKNEFILYPEGDQFALDIDKAENNDD